MKDSLEKPIVTLIEDNIANYKLVTSLSRIGIEASIYNSNSVFVILDLLAVKNEDRRKVLYTEYYDMIRNASRLDMVNERNELRKSALQIYFTLKKYSSEHLC